MKITKVLAAGLALCLLLSMMIACDTSGISTPTNSSNPRQEAPKTTGNKIENTIDSTPPKDTIDSVHWISQRQIWHQDDENRYVLVFCLLNDEEIQIAAPATVEIKIQNDKEEIVYSDAKEITTANYQRWYYNNGAVKKYQATIYINDNEINPGIIETGNIYFTVYNRGHFSFEESKLSIDQLPVDEINSVYQISECQVWHQSVSNRYALAFCLLSYSGKKVTVPATVEVRIQNDDGETVYSATKTITVSDYDSDESSKKQAILYIDDSEISYGDIGTGDIYFTVYNTGHFSFNEKVLSINHLPIKPTTIILPSVPDTITSYSYSGKKDSAVKITNITYEISGDDLYIYFTGEKIYDAEGDKRSRSCHIGWKLYDSEGYLVDSGVHYSDAIAVGEKFKNGRAIMWDVVKPGETLTLVLIDVRT